MSFDMLIPSLPAQTRVNPVLREAYEAAFETPFKNAASFRKALFEGTLMVNPMLTITREEAIKFRKLVQRPVAQGRMIDFGTVLRDVARSETNRSMRLFEKGELIHPFMSWVGTFADEECYSAYWVIALEPKPVEQRGSIVLFRGPTVFIHSMLGVQSPMSGPTIILEDMATIEMDGPDKTVIKPTTMRPAGEMVMPDKMRRCRLLIDPLVTMLRILNDASVPVRREMAPEKLNKARIRAGKPPIPSHCVADTRTYVTAFQTAQSPRKPNQGGTHASPVAHMRRAHLRHYKSGKVVPIHEMRVNWRGEEEMRRLFYAVKST